MDAHDELRFALDPALAEIGRLRAQIAAARRREAEAVLIDAIDRQPGISHR